MKSLLKKLITIILTWESQLIIRKYNPKIIAVTGSVGKTSTKDAIFAVFSKVFYARKSVKSFNSEFGLPLTIIGRPSGWNNPFVWLKNIFEGLALILFPNHYPKWLVLEIGADRPNDIKKVASWLRVDIAVFTRMSDVPVHVEFFKSPEAVFKEKMHLLKALKPHGTIVYNFDDLQIKNHILGVVGFKKISYGFDEDADIKASNYKIIYDEKNSKIRPIGINFKVDFNGSSLPVNILGTLGKQQVYATLAALAGAFSQDVNMVLASDSLSEYVSQAGRMKILSGVKDTFIIDDSYNSSPVALFEALQTVSDLKISGRKILILGDMMELGKYSVDEHKKAGQMVAQVADILVTVGIRARLIAESALEAGLDKQKILQFEDARLAGKQVELLLQAGDAVLVKGSQSIRLERAVEEIMAEPEKKEELLVRQDEEWKSR